MKHNWIYQGITPDSDSDCHSAEVYLCSFCNKEFILDSVQSFPDEACTNPIDLSSEGIKLWLDDERRAPFGWVHCNRVQDAKVLLLTGLITWASLDHDLGFTDEEDPLKSVECETGYDLCKWMAEHRIWPKYKPMVHSANPTGAANMRSVINRYGGYGEDK